MLFRRVNKPRASADLKQSDTLAQGAGVTYDAAKKEKLPLAYVAEQSGNPVFWFANSILHVVTVYGRRTDEADYVHLTREVTGKHTLAKDMTALTAADTTSTDYVDLRLTKSELALYMDWARTVQ